jgi:AcrR family transcriptional regulator
MLLTSRPDDTGDTDTMTTGTDGSKLRRDAADNHRRLLEAAVAEFGEQGMDACVEQIAARAGVGIGTFYRRFGTKDALVDRLVTDLIDEVVASAELRVATGAGDGLESWLREVATALVHHRGVLARVWSGRPAEQLRPLMLQLLANAQASGAIRTEVSGNDISVLMWSLRSIIEITRDAAGVACQRQLDFALAGMRPDAEPPRHPALSDRARLRAEHRNARSS